MWNLSDLIQPNRERLTMVKKTLFMSLKVVAESKSIRNQALVKLLKPSIAPYNVIIRLLTFCRSYSHFSYLLVFVVRHLHLSMNFDSVS